MDRKLALFLLLFLPVCEAQIAQQIVTNFSAPAAAGSWTFTQLTAGQSTFGRNLSCASAVCTLTVTSTGTGHGAVILTNGSAGSGATISSISGGCSVAWVVDASAHITNGPISDLNGAYCLSTTASATSVAVTFSSATPGTVQVYFSEGACSSNNVTKDTEGTANLASATPLAGPTLTLAATDFVPQQIGLGGGSPVVSAAAPYNTHFTNGDGSGTFSFSGGSVAITASGASASWTPTSATAAIANALALRCN